MKKFLIKLSYTVLPVWLFFVGLVCYVSLMVIPYIKGDLESLGLISFDRYYSAKLNQDTDTVMHFKTIDANSDAQQLHSDVLTVGDSFSQMGYEGYQNYLCQQGLTVSNIFVGKFDNPLEVAYRMLTLGKIDSTCTKALVVESAERMIDVRAITFTPEGPLPTPPVKNVQKGNTGNENMWSPGRARDFLYYRFIKSPVQSATLDGDYFSSSDPRKLYFYEDDLSSSMQYPAEHREGMKALFNDLCQKAEEKGINMILLVATDKYDLYQKHIVDNKWPEKTIMEDLAQIIGDNPHLLLSKQYLAPFIEQGEKDIYKFNDTHWSYKSSRIIATELAKRIKGYREERL